MSLPSEVDAYVFYNKDMGMVMVEESEGVEFFDTVAFQGLEDQEREGTKVYKIVISLDKAEEIV
jgi:hypothetical protein